MNREILYKAKVKDKQCNDELDWVYGDLIRELETGRCFICDLRRFDENTKLDDVLIEVIPETVSQYTGLDDMNGKKIFENDIVLYNTDPYDGLDKRHEREVVYDEEFNKFAVFENGICSYGVNQYLYNIEVIGNKFDNPELLDKEVK